MILSRKISSHQFPKKIGCLISKRGTEPFNSDQEAIISELRSLENAPAQLNSLNDLITELEIYAAAKKLKK